MHVNNAEASGWNHWLSERNITLNTTPLYQNTDRDHIYLLVNGRFVQMQPSWDISSVIIAEPGDIRVECDMHCNHAGGHTPYASHAFTFYPVDTTAPENVFSAEGE